MLIAATLAIFIVMILAIIRGVVGPSLYDRILAVICSALKQYY